MEAGQQAWALGARRNSLRQSHQTDAANSALPPTTMTSASHGWVNASARPPITTASSMADPAPRSDATGTVYTAVRLDAD